MAAYKGDFLCVNEAVEKIATDEKDYCILQILLLHYTLQSHSISIAVEEVFYTRTQSAELKKLLKAI